MKTEVGVCTPSSGSSQWMRKQEAKRLSRRIRRQNDKKACIITHMKSPNDRTAKLIANYIWVLRCPKGTFVRSTISLNGARIWVSQH